MIVATATDTAYVELTGVMLASLAAKAAGDFEAVYVFCDGVSDADKKRLAASYGLPNIAFVDLTDDMAQHFAAKPVNHHLSRTAYARILMPLALPEATGRLFYIDCDTLVNAPLAPLATLPMNGYPLAAVDDIAHQVPERHAKRNRDIGLPDEDITTWVDTRGFGGQKFASLAAHASQAENIFFLRLGQERFTELMGMETFVRVRDTTGAATPEDDLFAGLR